MTVRSSAATSRPSASAQRSGNHELRAGFSLSHDALSEFFVGNADGAYDFDTLQPMLTNGEIKSF